MSKQSTFKFRLLNPQEIDFRSKINPMSRSGHRIVADDAGDLYSFGGFNIKIPYEEDELTSEEERKFRPLFQELWKFDHIKREWTKLKTRGAVPDKLVSHCMLYWDGKIIVYGGTGLPYGDSSSNKLTVYHIASNYWELIEPTSDPSRTPTEMYGQACAFDESRGEIYVVGGTNGNQYSIDVHKFNLFTKKWTVLYKSLGIDRESIDREPGHRYRHEVALYNNKLYIFGGSTSDRFYAFTKLPVFDLETLDWTFLPTKPHVKVNDKTEYPRARKCHSLAVIGNECYLCAGTSGDRVLSDVWHINLDKLKWTLLVESIPYPVYFHGAALSLNSKLYIFGGVDHLCGDSRNNKLTSIWLKVPSLRNMCLEALEHYVLKGKMRKRVLTLTGIRETMELAESLRFKN